MGTSSQQWKKRTMAAIDLMIGVGGQTERAAVFRWSIAGLKGYSTNFSHKDLSTGHDIHYSSVKTDIECLLWLWKSLVLIMLTGIYP